MPTKPEEKISKVKFEAYEGTEPYLFISYSHADAEIVYQILNMLDDEKFRIWFDDSMEVGADFRDELKVRIENCSAFILFISKASMESKFCGMEIITAFKNNKKIFPIYVEDGVEIPAPLKIMLENLQHLNGFSIENREKYIQKMTSYLPMETMRSLVIENNIIKKCKDGSRVVNIPEGITTVDNKAFKECEQLEVIEIPSTLKEMRDEAFRGCKGIREIHIPENIRFVGESAFRDCIRLERVTVDNGSIEIGERAFENCQHLKDIVLPDTLAEIYGGMFNSCKLLKSIKLPSSLTVIGESAFASCTSLQELDVPESVNKLDDMAFSGCSAMKKIKLHVGVTKIGKNTFKDCISLKKIVLPSSVSSMGTSPFRGCVALESIKVDPKNKYFKSVDDILFNKNKSILICCPAKKDKYEYVVPDSVTVISDWAFCGCTLLNKITIPDSVNVIGEGAFYKCTGLRSVELPDSINRIDDVAFRGCTELEEIIIPKEVREFGWGVFNGCSNITVYCDDDSEAARYCEKKNIPYFPIENARG